MIYTTLWLEGPIQSWGADSRFVSRRTIEFPTRSGLTGIILASMGVSDPGADLLEQFEAASVDVISYSRKDRPNQGGILMSDYQTIGSAYEGNPLHADMIPKKLDGKQAAGGSTVVRHKEYLTDAAFGIVISSSKDFSLLIEKALTNPVWPISLGRKNCPPSEWVYRGKFEEAAGADRCLEGIALDRSKKPLFKVTESFSEDDGGEIVFLNDVPTKIRSSVGYKGRKVMKCDL